MERLALLFACVSLFCLPAAVLAEGKRPMKIDDLFAFKRVSDPQVSPDGKHVVYVVGSVDLAANKSSSALWLAASDGKSAPRQLTNAAGKKDSHPRWSPDGKKILFTSNRSGDGQLWLIALDGGEAKQLTTLSTEADTGIWSPDGKTIAFVSAVWPEFSDKPFKDSDAANKKKKEEIEKSPVKAKVHTKLFYRHWDSYVEDKRQHLFVLSADGGEPKDLTPGDRDAYPTSDTFSIGDDFTFSPDSKYILFTAPPDKSEETWSTNYDIWRVPVAGGESVNMTKDNKAGDSGPQFSPDGKHLAFRSQKRAGFEADEWNLMVVETDASGKWKGKPENYSGHWFSVESFIWMNNVMPICTANYRGSVVIYKWSKNTDIWSASGAGVGVNGSLSAPRNGDSIVVCTNAAMDHPAEVVVYRDEIQEFSKPIAITHENAKLLAEIDMPRPESVRVKVEGAEMQMWILKPPGFDPHKKWPLVYLVHGGPQGAWEDGWSFRWNPELWAAQGYVVALPNPRGSTGFGQKYTDEISGDWGGKCYDDLMKGVEYLEKQPYIDTERMAAAGASFGGYMMNWFQGNTTKFKTLITHCGVYDFDSMYGETDELWFDEWEHGGPPWGKHRDSYEKFSPHKKAANFKTPMLVISNDLDFRCPVGQGQELFTTLQRRKIPSKFINFPDEGHWVLKPKNSEFWHKEVFAWLAKYVAPGGK